MKKNYVGIACSQHDPVIAIINAEGEVVYAESTELHIQNKRPQPKDLVEGAIHYYSLINEEH